MPQVKSKFKHVAVEETFKKTDMAYLDIAKKFVTDGDTNFCSASGKYICTHMDGGGGPLLVMKLGMPGRKSRESQNVCKYHDSKVVVSGWSPHSDGLLASGDTAGNVFVHFFDDSMFTEDGLLKESIDEPLVKVETGFKKPISGLSWNPCVANLLAVCTKEKLIRIFDATSGAEACDLVIETKDVPISPCWSWDGNYLAFITKSGADNTVVLWKVRGDNQGEVWRKKTGMKSAQAIFMCHPDFTYVATTGIVPREPNRYFRLFDLEGEAVLGRGWAIPEKGSQQVMPFWDAGRCMMWYYGKGDLSVSFALWRPQKKEFFSMGLYRNAEPIKGGCFANQRAMDVMDCQVQVFYALCSKSGGNSVNPLKFSVPRRQKSSFAPELFPDCPGLKPVCTIEEWLGGAEFSAPNFITMDPDVEIDESGAAVFKKKLSYKELESQYEALVAALKSTGGIDALKEVPECAFLFSE